MSRDLVSRFDRDPAASRRGPRPARSVLPHRAGNVSEETAQVCGRSHSLDAPELPDGMALFGEPDHQGYLRSARTAAEQPRSVENSHQELMGVRRKADLAGEGA